MRSTKDATDPRERRQELQAESIARPHTGDQMRTAGLSNTPIQNNKVLLAALLLVVLASTPAAWSQGEAASPALTADEVVQHLMEKNRERAGELQHYASIRSYRLEYQGFPASAGATMQVEVNL